MTGPGVGSSASTVQLPTSGARASAFGGSSGMAHSLPLTSRHGDRSPRCRPQALSAGRPRRSGGDAQPAAVHRWWPGVLRPLRRGAEHDVPPPLRRRGALRRDGSTTLVAETGQDWDAVLLVRYPSREAFSRMVADPEYQEVTAWRTEALTEAVLQATVPW